MPIDMFPHRSDVRCQWASKTVCGAMGVDEELFDDMMSTSEADRERVNTLLAAEAPMKNISVIFYVALRRRGGLYS